MYEEALDRVDMNDRMARKRKHVDGNPAALTFKWGPFQFLKRPPTAVKAPFGGLERQKPVLVDSATMQRCLC